MSRRFAVRRQTQLSSRLRIAGSSMTTPDDEKRREELIAELTKLRQQVTDQNRIESALVESEARYRAVFESATIGIGILDDQRRFAHVNQALSNMLGYSKEELQNLCPLDITHPEDRERAQKHLEALERGEVDCYRFEKRYIRKDGRALWCDVSACALRYPGSKLTAILRIMSDITDRRESEEALRKSEERFRIITDFAHDWDYWVDPDWRLLYMSPSCECITGYTRDEFMRLPELLHQIIHPADRERVLRHFRDTKVNPEAPRHAMDFRIIRKDGTERWINHVCLAVHGRDGTPMGRRVSNRDITDRRLVEEELAESEERYRLLVELSPDGIVIVAHSDGKIIFANRAAAEILGASSVEALVGEYLWNFIHPEYHAMVRERVQRMVDFQTPQPWAEEKYLRLDGTAIDVEVAAVPVIQKGALVAQVMFRDISTRKRGQEELLRLATAIEQASETIEITGIDGTVLYVNPAFERTTGYRRDEAIGNNPRMLKSGKHDARFYEEMWATITRGEVWNGNFVNRRKDGKLFEEEASITPIKDAVGDIVNYVAVKRDVTKEVSLQRQLLQAQKMEAIGTLAGGIAHDFNNLLQVVLGYTELLVAEKDDADLEYHDLMRILTAANNGADLVQRLLTFSRKVEPKPVPLDLNRQIRQVGKLLRRIIPKMIEIKLNLSSPLAHIHADPTQMEQILMNLAVNARDAMPDGGTLTVATEDIILDEEFCKTHVGIQPGEYVQLTVSDTGHGMDKETATHVFEPFYTTKDVGRGTGLGLPMVYGIVQQHRGLIMLYSEVGTGAVFKMYFPAIGRPTETDMEIVGVLPAFGTETILMVDDEELIRELGARILAKAGYSVLQATNGHEALRIFEKERSRLGLIILDLIMPEVGGKQCLKELLAMDPQARVLMASGYSSDVSVRECLEIGAKGFVSKPYRMVELLQDVRKILDER